MTPPQATALFADFSDMRPSSKASFGRKSILKNSSAKKRHNQSVDSIDVPPIKVRAIYSSSESEGSDM